MHMYMYMYAYMFMYMYMYTYMYMYMYMYICICICICICTYVYMYMYMYLYTECAYNVYETRLNAFVCVRSARVCMICVYVYVRVRVCIACVYVYVRVRIHTSPTHSACILGSRWHDSSHSKCYNTETHHIEKIKFLGTNSN